MFVVASFSLWPINVWSLQIAFNWLLACFEIFEICFLKFSLLSVSITNSLLIIQWFNQRHLYFIQICLGLSWNLWSLIKIYLCLLLCSMQFQIHFVKFLKVRSNLYFPHLLCRHLQSFSKSPVFPSQNFHFGVKKRCSLQRVALYRLHIIKKLKFFCSSVCS